MPSSRSRLAVDQSISIEEDRAYCSQPSQGAAPTPTQGKRAVNSARIVSGLNAKRQTWQDRRLFYGLGKAE